MIDFQDAQTPLGQLASTYAETIINSIKQEYPNQMQQMMMGPEDRRRPREAHPVFYGCFDWHSSVEMHWALVSLLRLRPNAFDKTKAMEELGIINPQWVTNGVYKILNLHTLFQNKGVRTVSMYHPVSSPDSLSA